MDFRIRGNDGKGSVRRKGEYSLDLCKLNTLQLRPMLRIVIGMLQAFQPGEVLGRARFGRGLFRQEMHVVKP